MIKTAASYDETSAGGSVEVLVCAQEMETERLFLWAQLLDEDGLEKDRIFPVPLKDGASFRMEVKNARLWNAERPYFYDLALELREENGRLLGSTVKKLAFCVCAQTPEGYCVNGKTVPLCPFVYDGEKTQEQLAAAKRAGCNALLDIRRKPKREKQKQDADAQAESLQERCLQYGLYYVRSDQLSKETLERALAAAGEQAPGFSMEVTQQGVLIENHCLFADACEYDLRCSVEKARRILAKETLRVKIPPQSARFVEFSMTPPQVAGEYVYRAALCQRRDTPWAKKGDAIAGGTCAAANIYII